MTNVVSAQVLVNRVKQTNSGGSKTKHNAKVLRLPAVMMLPALALALEIAPAAAAPDATFDADGVWEISEQGTMKFLKFNYVFF